MKMINISLLLLSVTSLISCGGDGDTSLQTLDQATINQLVARHNVYRSEVGVDNISWSDELAKSAQQWANKLARNCDFKHSSSGYGENLWMGTSGAFTPNDVVDDWGAEKENYTYSNNSCSDVCGHYTQIVWSTTKFVGCAKVTCDGADIWVCQYDPPGNYVGEKPY